MPARKRAAPKKPKGGSGPKAFTAHGHKVTVRESARALVITIDGQVIPGARKLGAGEYHSMFLPFRGYPSATALARGLASQVGSTLSLVADPPVLRKPRKLTKRTIRGRS